jgi:hypothetical protein
VSLHWQRRGCGADRSAPADLSRRADGTARSSDAVTRRIGKADLGAGVNLWWRRMRSRAAVRLASVSAHREALAPRLADHRGGCLMIVLGCPPFSEGGAKRYEVSSGCQELSRLWPPTTSLAALGRHKGSPWPRRPSRRPNPDGQPSDHSSAIPRRSGHLPTVPLPILPRAS